MSEFKYDLLILTDEDKKRLTKVCGDTIDFIDKQTNNLQEKAFILRILIESFEETQNCIVPFKNRYTEPVYNYQKGFME